MWFSLKFCKLRRSKWQPQACVKKCIVTSKRTAPRDYIHPSRSMHPGAKGLGRPTGKVGGRTLAKAWSKATEFRNLQAMRCHTPTDAVVLSPVSQLKHSCLLLYMKYMATSSQIHLNNIFDNLCTTIYKSVIQARSESGQVVSRPVPTADSRVCATIDSRMGRKVSRGRGRPRKQAKIVQAASVTSSPAVAPRRSSRRK